MKGNSFKARGEFKDPKKNFQNKDARIFSNHLFNREAQPTSCYGSSLRSIEMASGEVALGGAEVVGAAYAGAVLENDGLEPEEEEVAMKSDVWEASDNYGGGSEIDGVALCGNSEVDIDAGGDKAAVESGALEDFGNCVESEPVGDLGNIGSSDEGVAKGEVSLQQSVPEIKNSSHIRHPTLQVSP